MQSVKINIFKLLMHTVNKHSKLYEELRQDIIKIIAHSEAYIEFEEDEDDVKSDLMHHVGDKVNELITKLKDYLEDNKVGQVIREGVKICIIGPPNVGKSSLINKLSNTDLAIVSDIPGTTRDSLSTTLNIKGQSVTLTDTAGLRLTQDDIEKEGIKRSKSHLTTSQAIICVFSFEYLKYNPKKNHYEFKDESIRTEIQETLELAKDKDIIFIVNKSDLQKEEREDIKVNINFDTNKILPIKAMT